jgi:outer membrane beta-barrel protein
LWKPWNGLKLKSMRVGILLCVVSASAVAAEFKLPKSDVDTYRVESHYGPEEALLDPVFDKNNNLELSGGYGWAPLSSLVNYGVATGSLVWHFNRRHAFEPIAFGMHSGDSTNFVKTQIADKISSGKRATLGVEVPQQSFAASYLFSPYNAKLSLSSRNVSHFDIYFGFGGAMIKTQETLLNGTDGAEQTRPAVAITAGMRFLFRPRFALRFEVRDLIHTAKNIGEEGTVNTLQVGLAASFFFSGFN